MFRMNKLELTNMQIQLVVLLEEREGKEKQNRNFLNLLS